MTQVIDKAFNNLSKSIDVLRTLSFPDASSTLGRRNREPGLTSKDKIAHCHSITDTLTTSGVRNHPEYSTYFSKSFETFLLLCNDPDSNVRMVADSSLNRVIRRVLSESNATRVQVELYKEMKKNGPARSLRTALTKFASLARMIRWSKARLFAVSIGSCLATVAKRPEDPVQDDMGKCVEPIWEILGTFCSDEETKRLIDDLLANLQLQSLSARRAAATCLVTFCKHARKPAMFAAYLLKQLLDTIIPINFDHSPVLIMGVFFTLKQLISLLKSLENDERESSPFGDGNESKERNPLKSGGSSSGGGGKLSLPCSVHIDHLCQLFEVSLYFACHANGSVCAAALECLAQLLRAPPANLCSILTSPDGIAKSLIFPTNAMGASFTGLGDSGMEGFATGRFLDSRLGGSSCRPRKASFANRSGYSSLAGSQNELNLNHPTPLLSLPPNDDALNFEEPGVPIYEFPSPDNISEIERTPSYADQFCDNVDSKSVASVEQHADSHQGYSTMEIGICIDDQPSPVGPSSDRIEVSSRKVSAPDPLGVTEFTVDSGIEGSSTCDGGGSELGSNGSYADGNSVDKHPLLSPLLARGPSNNHRTSPLTLAGLERVTSSEAMDQFHNYGQSTPASPNSASIKIPDGIGNFTDADVPLVYCSRLLAVRYLLTGIPGETIPDREARVSHKVTALSCISAMVSLEPRLMGLELFRRDVMPCSPGLEKDPTSEIGQQGLMLAATVQRIWDVLLFWEHSDPQLRGGVAEMISLLLEAVAVVSGGEVEDWISENFDNLESVSANNLAGLRTVNVEIMFDILMKLICDETANTVRAAVLALNKSWCCLTSLKSSSFANRAMKAALATAGNSYWLTKIELATFLSSVDYCKFELFNHDGSLGDKKSSKTCLTSTSVQDQVLCVLLDDLLSSNEPRVQKGVASAVGKIVNKLYFANQAGNNCLIDFVGQSLDNLLLSYSGPSTSLSIMNNGTHHKSLGRNMDWSSTSLESVPLVLGLASGYKWVGVGNPSIPDPVIECNLSRVVDMVVERMLGTSSPSHLVGMIGVLTSLCDAFPPGCYRAAWFGTSVLMPNDEVDLSGTGLLRNLFHYLQSTPLMHDIEVHHQLLRLIAEYFSGIVIRSMLATRSEFSSGLDGNSSASSYPAGGWSLQSNPTLKEISAELLLYCLKFLNCAWTVMTETPSSSQLGVVSTIGRINSFNPSSHLSPAKTKLAKAKTMSGDTASVSETSSSASGSSQSSAGSQGMANSVSSVPKLLYGDCGTSTQFGKLTELLRGSYANYKCSGFDHRTMNNDRFLKLVRSCLTCLCHVLEVMSLADVSKYVEEFLLYLKVVAAALPTESVYCVQQILKALFGTNLTIVVPYLRDYSDSSNGPSQILTSASGVTVGGSTNVGVSHFVPNYCPPSAPYSLYQTTVMKPYTRLTQTMASALARYELTMDSDLKLHLGWMKLRHDKHVLAMLRGATGSGSSGAEKSQLTGFIRMFEPVVIQALKLYTNSTDPTLQSQVIELMIQLVQVRVNYGLLDADLRFLKFIYQQLEEMESCTQLVRRCDVLIRVLFEFMVVLSYEKNTQGASVVEVSRIIQLINGLMALGGASLAALPAIQVTTLDLFMIRPGMRVESVKDLDAQKEVVLDHFVKKTVQHSPQSVDLLCFLLHQTRALESAERWRTLSRDLVDLVIPLMIRNEINLSRGDYFQAVTNLFELVCPSAFRPIDIMLDVMFGMPGGGTISSGLPGGRYVLLNSPKALSSWIALQFLSLRTVILHCKEDTVLSRLDQGDYHVVIDSDLGELHRNGVQLAERHVDRGEDDKPSPVGVLVDLCLTVVDLSARELHFYCTTLNHLSRQELEPSIECLAKNVYRYCQLILHMVQSGNFRKFRMSLKRVIELDQNAVFSRIVEKLLIIQPHIALLWLNLLVVLEAFPPHLVKFWRKQLLSVGPDEGPTPKNEIGLREVIVQSCLLAFSDHARHVLINSDVADPDNDSVRSEITNLVVHIAPLLLAHSHEPPIEELTGLIKKDPELTCRFLAKVLGNSQSSGHDANNTPITLRSSPSVILQFINCLGNFVNTEPVLILEFTIKTLIQHHLTLISFAAVALAHRCVEAVFNDDGATGAAVAPPLSWGQLTEMIEATEQRRLAKRCVKLHDSLIVCRQMWYDEQSSLARTLSSDGDHLQAIMTICSGKFNKMKFVQLIKLSHLAHLCSTEALAQMLSNFTYEETKEILCNELKSPECLSACFSRGLALWQESRDASQACSPGSELCASSRPLDSGTFPLLAAVRAAILGSIRQTVGKFEAATSVGNQASGRGKYWKLELEGIVLELGPVLTAFLEKCQKIQLIPDPELLTVVQFSVIYLELVASSKLVSLGLTGVLDACQCVSRLIGCTRLMDCLGDVKLVEYQMKLIDSVFELCRFGCCYDLADYAYCVFPFNLDSEQLENCWKKMSAMLNWAEISHSTQLSIPSYVLEIFRRTIFSVARLPVVTSFSRTPEVAFKFGWIPDFRTLNGYRSLTTTPVHHLQNTDILRQFLFRINAMGWCSRKQFEETWMGLVGVLSATPIGAELTANDAQTVSERISASSLAVRCLSALLLQTLLAIPGNPQASTFVMRHREHPPEFLKTNYGRRLLYIKGKLNRLRTRRHLGHRSDQCPLFGANPERVHDSDSYGYGQLSVPTLWQLIGLLAAEQKLVAITPTNQSHVSLASQLSSGTELTTPQVVHLSLENEMAELKNISTVPGSDPLTVIASQLTAEKNVDTSIPEASPPSDIYIDQNYYAQTNSGTQAIPSVQSPDSSIGPVRRSISNFLLTGESLPDVVSCLHFLLELYSHWLSKGPDCVPISLLSATMESMVLLSDMLCESSQYEWLREKLRLVFHNHFVEDELILQYLITGLAKCSAVLGSSTPDPHREVLDLLDNSLRNPQLGVRLAAVHGALYLLQTLTADQSYRMPEMLCPYVLGQIERSLLAPQQDFPMLEKPQNQQHLLAVWALGFYLIKHFRGDSATASFMPSFFDLCCKLIDTSTASSPLYEAVIHGLETTVVSCDLDPNIVAQVTKLVTKKIQSFMDPDITVPAMELMLTCLYASKEGRTSLDDESDTNRVDFQTPEPQVSAMEKLTLFLNKVSCGVTEEANAVCCFLPAFLTDNFNPGDLVNKLICELLSPNQARPRLMAQLLYKIFESLHEQETMFLVCDWALLSLPNFVHKIPVEFSVWATTAFLLSAIANPWMKAVFPLVLDREAKQVDIVDSNLFILAVTSFRSQLEDPSQIESFLLTMKNAATEAPDSPYVKAVNVLENF